MIKQLLRHGTAWLLLAAIASAAPPIASSGKVDAPPEPAAEKADKADAEKPKTYQLRYQFKPGEMLRWEVEHRAQIRTTVAGTTQTAETTSISVKVWKINAVDAQGNATFEHMVESVDMRQKLTGRQEVRYDSTTDKEVPPGFQDVAKNVGVLLSVITIDRQGKIIHRDDKREQPASATTHMAVPLPDNAVAIGEHWLVPYEVTATAKDGSIRTIKMRQQVTLEEVTGGVATLDVEAQVLSPVRDPTIEAQLVQSELNGKVRFDISSGRVLSQKNNSDKHVVGYQGATSSMHYVAQFAEKLLGDPQRTASKPKIAGPQPAAVVKPATKPVASTAPSAAPAGPTLAPATASPVTTAPVPTAPRTTAPVNAAPLTTAAKPAPPTAKPAPAPTAQRPAMRTAPPVQARRPAQRGMRK
jgi:hypothetical protein